MSNHIPSSFKAAATVREVCKLVRLSTARFYELQQAGVFPLPVYDVRTRRPMYTEELQRQCVHIRDSGCGVNGQPVIFYTLRKPATRVKRPQPVASTASVSPPEDADDALAAVRTLGLAAATMDEVRTAMALLFHEGTTQVSRGEVIRQVFVHLNRNRGGRGKV